jgi:hypothetical protein
VAHATLRRVISIHVLRSPDQKVVSNTSIVVIVEVAKFVLSSAMLILTGELVPVRKLARLHALRPSHGSCEFFCRGLYRKAGRSAMVVSIKSERSRCVPRAQRDSDRTNCAANTGVCAQACPLRSTPCRTCSFGTSWPCAHAWIATVTCIHDACMHKCRE